VYSEALLSEKLAAAIFSRPAGQVILCRPADRSRLKVVNRDEQIFVDACFVVAPPSAARGIGRSARPVVANDSIWANPFRI